jgi:hypothetical protein
LEELSLMGLDDDADMAAVILCGVSCRVKAVRSHARGMMGLVSCVIVAAYTMLWMFLRWEGSKYGVTSINNLSGWEISNTPVRLFQRSGATPPVDREGFREWFVARGIGGAGPRPLLWEELARLVAVLLALALASGKRGM